MYTIFNSIFIITIFYIFKLLVIIFKVTSLQLGTYIVYYMTNSKIKENKEKYALVISNIILLHNNTNLKLILVVKLVAIEVP